MLLQATTTKEVARVSHEPPCSASTVPAQLPTQSPKPKPYTLSPENSGGSKKVPESSQNLSAAQNPYLGFRLTSAESCSAPRALKRRVMATSSYSGFGTSRQNELEDVSL